MNQVLALARRNILSLCPYESARSLNIHGEIFLDANESPLPPEFMPAVNRYPEPQPIAILKRFSEIYQVLPSMIQVGRGSDEAIDLLIRAFCEPERDCILTFPPTYKMYEVCSNIQGSKIIQLPLIQTGANFHLDIDRIKDTLYSEKNLKIIFICSPNNPTGNVFDADVINQICEMSLGRCLVVIDEAYAEFSQTHVNSEIKQRLSRFPHLVILRTLSKAWAMAGIRCGAVIANPELIQLLNRIRAPYPLNTPGIELILKGTDLEKQESLKQRVCEIRTQRNYLKEELTQLKMVEWIASSETNYLLLKIKNSKSILKLLKSKGIIIRDRGSDVGLKDCVRVTVGTPDENRALISILQKADI